ncbi:MAG: HEPN domain-containing protein [Candidatus Micrarchaeota archaeon]
MLDLEGCMEKGLIKKTPPSKEQALLGMEKAEEVLEDAKANLEEERYNSAAMLAYVSMLNAARAVLFRDGYREKSHYCISRYLEEKYGDVLGKEMVKLLDAYRETRHEVQYSAAYNASPMEAEEMVGFAGRFLKKVEEILEEK